MLPQQPIKLSNSYKSLMKYGELFNKHFCKNKFSSIIPNETAEISNLYFSHYKSIENISCHIQYNPDRTRWSGSTELMRVIGEARIKYPIFSGPTNFYVYGSIRYCLLYATVLLIFDPIKCVKFLEAIN